MKLGFILNPLHVSEFYENRYLYAPYDGLIGAGVKFLSPRKVKTIYSKVKAHRIISLAGLDVGLRKLDIDGYMCTVFPEDFIKREQKSLEKLMQSIDLAIRLKCQYLVLTGFTSILYSKYFDMLADKYAKKIVITSGNTYTAVLGYLGVLKALKLFNLSAKDHKVSIIGASGDIGSGLAPVLAEVFGSISLCSRKISTSTEVYRCCSALSKKVEITKDIPESIRGAKCIVLATNSYLPLLSETDVPPNAIVCDISLPHNVSADFVDKRSDVFVFDGGKAKINSSSENPKWKKFAQNGNLYGCIAEGIILAAHNLGEGKIVKGSIRKSDLDSMVDMSSACNITLADFSYHGMRYTEQQLHNYTKVHTS